MRCALGLSSTLIVASLAGVVAGDARAGWRVQELGTDLNVVYAVDAADMNRDGRVDVVAVNNTQVIWWENPGRVGASAAPAWKKHVVLDGVLQRAGQKDHVCFAVDDIDGDGWLDLALGADWQPTNTAAGGSLQWLRRTSTTDHDAPWEVFPISQEPTLHRMRWGDVTGDGRKELVVAPLHGRGAKKPDWDGPGARLLVFHKPKAPTRDPWLVEVADESLHIVHNLFVEGGAIYTASKEGASVLRRDRRGAWTQQKLGEGQFGEIKPGRTHGARTLGLVEPWHGTTLVALRAPKSSGPNELWTRELVDPALTEGHAVAWADFDRDGHDELVAGWRGKPYGLATYARTPDGRWQKTLVDDGMATEDAITADLDGDRHPEIIAGGRATKNVRIYWRDPQKDAPRPTPVAPANDKHQK